MQLFLMRHGEASFDAPSDRERKLTELGRKQSREMTKVMNQTISQFDLVLVSPYLRAQQTWQEVSQHFPKPRHLVVLDDITPNGDASRAADAILAYADQYKANTVLVVTHMPVVSYLVSEIVAGTEPVMFSTSGLAHIDKHMEQANLVAMHHPQ